MIVWRVVDFIVHRINWCEWLIIGNGMYGKHASHVGSDRDMEDGSRSHINRKHLRNIKS